MAEMHKIYGKALSRLRKRADLTQAQCAELIGIEAPSWTRYENGTSKSLLKVDVLTRCVEVMGFTLADFNAEVEAFQRGDPIFNPAPVPTAANDTAPVSKMMFPLDGVVRGSEIGVAVFDEEEAEDFDFARYLGKNIRVLRVVGDSMFPMVEPGGFVTYDKNGVPRRNSLAVVRLKDGQYFIKKFMRMTQTTVECIEMDQRMIDGAVAYVEKPRVYDIADVKAVYPVGIRID